MYCVTALTISCPRVQEGTWTVHVELWVTVGSESPSAWLLPPSTKSYPATNPLYLGKSFVTQWGRKGQGTRWHPSKMGKHFIFVFMGTLSSRTAGGNSTNSN